MPCGKCGEVIQHLCLVVALLRLLLQLTVAKCCPWMQSTRHAGLLARCWAARAGQGWEGGQWPDMLWGGVIGLQLALASYVFGEQCALLIVRHCLADGAAEAEPQAMLEKCGHGLLLAKFSAASGSKVEWASGKNCSDRLHSCHLQ